MFSILALSFILPSGNYDCISSICSLHIGNWHMHDALWHISLAKLGFTSWPLQNPYMAGEPLTSYNFLLDYLLNILVRLGISPFFSFFKLLPIMATILYIFSVLSYIKTITKNQVKANIVAFFLYFGSSATYLATLYANHTLYYASLRGFPVVSVINPTTMFLNIQYALSLSIFLWIILLQHRPSTWIKNLLIFVLFFLLFGFKFYGGVVALAYFVGINILKGIWGKNYAQLANLLPGLLGSYLGLLLFYGLSKSSETPFTWSPFSLTHLMIEDPLLFGNQYLTLARYYLYENMHGFSPRLLAIESLCVVLFLVINFGTRLLGLYYLVRNTINRRVTQEQLVMGIIILLTVLAPILFVQNGGWYNTMQFLYYGTWLAGLLTAEYVFEKISTKSHTRWFFFALVILLTIPNCVEQLRFISEKQTVVEPDEIAMLDVLRKESFGVVHISESVHKQGLVPALAEKPVYYLDTDQLMVTHAKYQERLAFMEKYGGGSMATVPADYYLIYKQDYGAQVAIVALTSPTQYQIIFESDNIVLYKKIH